ncbi:MAG: response regulator [Ignavibacteriales bacterium]
MQKKTEDVSSILYVEDDSISREVVAMFLRNNFSLETAVDSSEAMEKLKANNYSVILLDISLYKGLDGLELAREIRKLKNYKKVPIIAVTALAFREDEKRILKGGCSHYISKPFSRKLLLDTINNALSK